MTTALPTCVAWRVVCLSMLLQGAHCQLLAQVQGPDRPVHPERERVEQQRGLLATQTPDHPVLPEVARPTEMRSRRLRQEFPCMPIRDVDAQGSEPLRLPEGWLAVTLAGPAGDDGPQGRCLGTEGITILAARLQDDLIARGWVTTRVVVPPQQLDGGSLRLEVVPGRLRQVRGAAPRAGVLPPLMPGEVLNVRAIEQALETLQRVPTVQASIQIAPAASYAAPKTPHGPGGQPPPGTEDVPRGPGWSDLVIDWRQERKWRAAVTLDDSGSPGTGRLQSSGTLSLDSPLNLNDLFYLSYGSSAGWAEPGPRGNRSTTLHYSVPIGWWLLSGTISRSHFHQSVAGATQVYVYSGHTRNDDLRLARQLHRDARGRTSAHVRAFARGSANFIEDTEVELLIHQPN